MGDEYRRGRVQKLLQYNGDRVFGRRKFRVSENSSARFPRLQQHKQGYSSRQSRIAGQIRLRLLRKFDGGQRAGDGGYGRVRRNYALHRA